MIYHSKKGQDTADSYSVDDLDEECKAACRGIKPHLGEFDVVAVTGLSGIVPGVGVALKLKVPLAILRKPGDDTHQYDGAVFEEGENCSYWVGGEAITEGTRVLWLDDFCCMGYTRKRIRAAVEALGGKVVAEYLTREGEWSLP